MRPRSLLITGASSGLGAAIASAAAEPGVALALCAERDRGLTEIETTCRQRGAAVDSEVVDVRDTETTRAWINRADARAPLDCVIANAGISASGIADDELLEQEALAREIVQVNLLGVINTIYPAIELMRPRRRGHVVLISSLAGLAGYPPAPVYAATKAAVRVLGMSLRGRLRASGVELTIVSPGHFWSNMVRTSKNQIMDASLVARRVLDDVARNTATDAFPRSIATIATLLSLSPAGVRDYVGRFF